MTWTQAAVAARTWTLAGLGAAASALSLLVAAVALGRPALAVVGALGLVALPTVIAQGSVALVVLVGVEVGNLTAVASQLGVPRPTVLLLALAGTSAVVYAVRHRLRRPPLTLLFFVLAYLCATSLSALVAKDQALATLRLGELAKDVAFFVVILVLAAWTAGHRRVVQTLVAVVAALAGLGVVQQYVLGNSTEFAGLSRVPLAQDIGFSIARHSGPYADANFWGRVLVMVLPLGLALFAATRGAPRRRTLWLGGVLAVLGGVYLTGSRGALVAVVVTVLTWMLVSGRRYARLLVLAPLVLALVIALPGVGSRLASLADTSTTDAGVADPSLSGRIAAQEVALRMAAEHPVLGIGAGNFESASSEYQRRFGIASNDLAPHNLYLQQAAEGGLVVLLAWLAMVGAALALALRARSRWRRLDGEGSTGTDWYLASGALAALVGWSAASVFLHLATFRVFLVLLAVIAVLDDQAGRLLTTRGEAARSRDVVLPRDPPARRGSLVPSLVLALALPMAVSAALPQVRGALSVRYAGSAAVSVQPSRPEGGSYVFDVAGRQLTRSTVLSLLGDPNLHARAAQAAGVPGPVLAAASVGASDVGASGVLLVTVASVDERTVRELPGAIRAETTRWLAENQAPFRLEPEESADVTARRSWHLTLPRDPGAIPLVWFAAALVGFLSPREGRRRLRAWTRVPPAEVAPPAGAR